MENIIGESSDFVKDNYTGVFFQSLTRISPVMKKLTGEILAKLIEEYRDKNPDPKGKSMSIQDFSDKSDVKYDTIRITILKNKGLPEYNVVNRILQTVGVDPAVYGYGAKNKIKVTGYLKAGQILSANDNKIREGSMISIPASLKDSIPIDSTEAIVIEDDSLPPFKAGWTFFIVPCRPADLIGQLAIVQTKGSSVRLIREVQAAKLKNKYHLISYNGIGSLFDQEVIWAARIAGIAPPEFEVQDQQRRTK